MAAGQNSFTTALSTALQSNSFVTVTKYQPYAPASHLGNNHKAPGTWLPGNSLALMRRMAKGLLHDDLAACRAYVGGLDAAAKVNVAALVLIGQYDMMTPPKAAQSVLAALKNSRTETIKDAGHNMTSEAADAVLAALWRFANA